MAEEEKKQETNPHIINAPITSEMEKAYLNYAMSVIVARALPDVRDGLKPVHRRIIYAMKEQGIGAGSRYQKCAAVVGEVLKKYHPHGDAAVYDSLVRMAQMFSLRYTLVDGQGNFGSVDGDSPAAMRYTEARLSQIAEELLLDIDKDTVDFIPNYSGTDNEPTLLPSAIPNLLFNGASGIAVGLATSIPSHNLSEVVDAVIHTIEKGKPELKEKRVITLPVDYPYSYLLPPFPVMTFRSSVTVDELLEFVKGPDFPTGGIIYDISQIRESYATGKGSIIMRAKAKIEEGKGGKFSIVITELPYQVNKAEMVARIADLARDKKIEGISDLRDESDRQGMRVVVELKKDSRPQQVLNNLYKHTEMQKAFHVNTVALVNGEPKLLSLKNILEEFIIHRQNVVIRRTFYLLKRAKEREHILEGLKIALDHLTAVIETIKKSKDADEAKINLVKKFKLTPIQAQAILDMQLRRLAALERIRIEEELKETIKTVKGLEAIIADHSKVLETIKDDLSRIKKKYGDERKTKVIKGKVGEWAAEDLIREEEVLITLTQSGYVKRLPSDTYKTQGRGGKGVIGSSLREGDTILEMHTASTHDDLLFFTNKGRVYALKTWDLPEASRTAKGTAVVNVLNLMSEEKVKAIVPLRKGDDSIKHLFMATKNGTVKRTDLTQFDNIRKNGIIAIKLDEGDDLSWVKPTSGNDQIMVISELGKSIRFKEGQIRSMGRNAAGVRGIRLGKTDKVQSTEVIESNQAKHDKDIQLLVVCENGYGKRTKLNQYRIQNRGGTGIAAAKVTKKTGKIIASRIIDKEVTDIIITSTLGQVIRFSIKDVSVLGRSTQGVRVMRLESEDSAAAMTILKEDEKEEEKPEK